MQNIDTEKLWSVEAEAGVLGSIVLDSGCIGKILPILDGNSFFKPEHQTIYDALIALFLGNNPTDAVALRTQLKAINQLEQIGGVEYIARLLESVPSSANAVYYAGVVKDRQKYRDLIGMVDLIGKVFDEPLGVDDQIQRIQDLALGFEKSKLSTEYFTLAEHAEKVAIESQEQTAVIETGFRNIDHIVGGVSPGELIIVAGRPSMGKSALALQFALTMAKAGLSILFFTLEMTYRALIERALKNEQAVELSKLDVVLHEGCETPEKQIAFIKTRKQTHKVDAVFVDYLQLMSTGRKSENRVQEITTISRKLKLAAISENVPIIALSQLNREVETREKHRPRLSDLRESGAIEQDADVVLLLHRDDYYRRNQDPDAPQDGNAELIVAKNRRGPTGIAELVFLDEFVRFGDRVKSFSEGLI